ncbi:MAG: hypothetical protein Q7R83_00155 [bacterium]|nr:hypothetical protein [bacterium]
METVYHQREGTPSTAGDRSPLDKTAYFSYSFVTEHVLGRLRSNLIQAIGPMI